MRHLRSILYALVLAPATWVLTGVGLTDELHGRGRQYAGVESFSGLLLLLLAGAAYAILVFAPISPAGPTLFGLAFIGATGWALAAPSSYASVWPSGVTKADFDLSRPGYGLAALLAVPLICTALSVRRWERYEPPRLPLIGTWGRPRGAASAAETPVAAASTQIIPQVGLDGDATQVIRAAKAPEPVATRAIEAEEPTVVEGSKEPTDDVSPEEPTTASASEEPVADEVRAESGAADSAGADTPAADTAAADEPSTDEPTTEEPTAAGVHVADQPEVAGEETAAVATTAVNEPIDVAMPAAARSTETEPTQIVAKSEPVAAAPAQPEAETEPTQTDAEATQAGIESPQTETAASDPADQPTATTEPITKDAEPKKRSIGERTATIANSDQDQTQIIRLPVGELPTRDLHVSPGERTQVISSDRFDEPQVIRVPQQRTESADGERTQVIRLPNGTVEPLADRTQVLRLPTPDDRAGDRTSVPGETATEETAPRDTAPAKPGRPRSIVAQERPDPGADPTTLLGWPQAASATQAEPGDGNRAMTVMNLERPAGEAADDTRPLRPRTPPEHDETL